MNKYDRWIRHLIEDQFDGAPSRTYGQCQELANEMQMVFPELEIVRGHVEALPPWGRRSHWWLRTKDGVVVDPSAGQFPGIIGYEEYKDGDPVRLGSCANCGESIWGSPEQDHPTVCSPECSDAYVGYLNGGDL